MSGSHKHTVDQFTHIVNSRHVHHLEKVLEENVEKTENSKTAFKNLQEAREYYAMEHEAHPSEQWSILEYGQEDENNHTLKAHVLYNNHKYNTTYTFSSSGKIQKIDTVIDQQQ
jgi:D-lyxose ketol-isomerase